MQGTNWAGAPVEIGYGTDPRPTLVYTFTRECPACRQTWPGLRNVQAIAPARLRMVYVDITDKLTEQFLNENGVPLANLLISLSEPTRAVYGARIVPQSELLNAQGRVIWTHVGTLEPTAINEIISAVNEAKGEKEKQ